MESPSASASTLASGGRARTYVDPRFDIDTLLDTVHDSAWNEADEALNIVAQRWKNHHLARAVVAWAHWWGLGSWVIDKARARALYNNVDIGYLEDLAEIGDMHAQCHLGWILQLGLGSAARDPVKAVKLYKCAAFGNHAVAKGNLGFCKLHGIGINKDPSDAARLLRLAASAGNAIAMVTLGKCFERGMGVPRSMVDAVFWYQNAANQGSPHAQYQLAMCLDAGKGIAPNVEHATRLLRTAASQGEMNAKRRLGQCRDPKADEAQGVNSSS